MGGLLSRHKKEGVKKTFDIRFCPTTVKQPPIKPIKNETIPKTVGNTSEWTDVHLQVPESLPSKKDIQSAEETPIPPPRKQRGKHVIQKTVENLSAATVHNNKISAQQIPIEEPIIIPQKVPIHICDGTHNHAINIVPGTINIETKKVENIHNERMHSRPRPKNVSTVSLPNYQEFTSKSKKREIIKPIDAKKKKSSYHVSAISLPTESKVSLSATTAARLENYMMRCKSFGKLAPQELLEQLQKHGDFSSDSDDSWEGLDDWDMRVLENDAHTSPLEPKCRLNAPIINTTYEQINEVRLPTTIEEVDEATKQSGSSPTPLVIDLNSLKKTEGRRESIDDFFDAKATNPFKTVDNETEVKYNYLGRRGSDGFFGYDKKCFPFKSPSNDPTFNSDTFFTNALLHSESQINPNQLLNLRRKSAGAALHHSNSSDTETKPDVSSLESGDDLLNTFQNFYSQKTADLSEIKIGENKSISNDKCTISEMTNDTAQHVFMPRRKSGAVEHSSLLKFIQNNSLQKDNNPVETSLMQICQDDKINEMNMPEPLRSAIKEEEYKIKKIDNANKENN